MKLPIFIKNYLLIVISLAICHFSYGQIFNPEIENYSIENYKASNQNWGIDVNNKGVVFVANHKGLLKYNGQTWKLYELPNKTIVRSVLCVDDRIYTGSYEEFGFWTKNNFGDYTYTSLTPLFDKNHEFKSEEFWQIIKYENLIIVKSFGGIYVYNGESISYIIGSQDASEITIYDNKVIVGSWSKGLKELKQGRLIKYNIPTINVNFKAVSILASFKENLFFFDINEGGFIYDSKSLFHISKTLNNLLIDFVINKVDFIDENTIVFGTIKNGILVYNILNKSIKHINKESGLQNNTVLGLKSHKGNIWSALDNGIGKIDFDNANSYYRNLSGTLGTVYDVAYFKGRYYLASNTGLHYFTEDNNKLEFINGSEGQVWDLSIMDNQLICGHNNGVYFVENNSLHLVDSKMGGVFSTVKIPKKERWFLLGAYSGINLLKKIKGKWQSKLLENINFPVSKVVFESDSVIWATHPYKGVYRIKLNKEYSKAIEIKSFGNNTNFKQFKTKVYSINNSVVFYNSPKWFQYFKNNDSIGLFKRFQKFNGKDLISKENNGFWFIDRKKEKEFLFVNNKFEEVFHLRTPEIEKRLVFDYEKVIIKNDSIRFINLNDGISIFNLNKLKNKFQLKNDKPEIERVYSRENKFSIKDSVIRVPFKDARYLTFEFYTPNLYKTKHSYMLSGEFGQKNIINKGKVIFQNLAYDDYILYIKNVSNNSKQSVFKKYRFKVLPPWYLTNLMKAAYILIIIGVLYVVFKLNRIKIRKQQIALQQEYIRETQKKINKIEKENLENEIYTKKRELTNTTASIIKKNEIIILLRNELNRLLDVSPNQYRSKRLLNLSKDYINNEKDWKIFEANFNELNEDFFKSLISRFPKLTSKDLKLCAYIKTGLTSKEIAPLMGISLRGVELHRYRLRKKINLSQNDSLSNYLLLL